MIKAFLEILEEKDNGALMVTSSLHGWFVFDRYNNINNILESILNFQ